MENVFITWHYTTHGVAYLKHILSEFYRRTFVLSQQPIKWKDLEQAYLNKEFNEVNKKGFLFDKVYYLTTDFEVFRNISHRSKYRKHMIDDPLIKKEGTKKIWKKLLGRQDIDSPEYKPDFESDLKYVRENFSEEEFQKFYSQLWRDIQHYDIDDQLKWFKEHSNAKNIYGERLVERKTNVKNLRDAKDIAKETRLVLDSIRRKHPNANFYINICLGSSETQVVWHALSEANYLPINCKFLQTYDAKDDDTHIRFKNFYINEVPIRLFDELKPTPVFKDTNSEKRKVANLKMKYFIKAGFSILILGERGTGKSRLAKEYKDIKQNFVNVNCASFDDDSKAEIELFGYAKGAFRGANDAKDGLFHKANNGVLFLDEIHQLSKRVQEKLMKALQTDEYNFFQIRKVGSSKEDRIKCTVIFATNKSINELRGNLLDEAFFDRIAQNVVDLPSLKETPEDRKQDWKRVWESMKFEEDIPLEKDFIDWLSKLELAGNFRDLQKIAIYFNNYINFDINLKSLLRKDNIQNELDYVIREFERLQSKKVELTYFSKEKSTKEMEAEFKKDLAIWANKEFGSMQKAADYFQEEFDETLTSRTLYKWKNGK